MVWGLFFLHVFESTNENPHLYPLGVFSLVWSIGNLVLCIIFVVIKVILGRSYRIKEAWEPGIVFRQKTHLDLELSRFDTESHLLSMKQIDEMNEESPSPKMFTPALTQRDGLSSVSELEVIGAEDRIGAQQMKYRYLATKLRYCSFILEGLIGISTITLVAMNAIIRMWVDEHKTDFADVL